MQLQDLDRLRFIGTATSHFQAEPLTRGPRPQLDWEDELSKNLERKASHIRTPQRFADLPRFLERRRQYAERSAEIGMNMFRFSMEFGRLSPEIGEFDDDLMGRYVGFIARLKTLGQEPMVTLQHYAMPLSLVTFDRDGSMHAGAWENPLVLKHFRYCMERIIRFFNDADRMHAALSEAGILGEQAEKLLTEGMLRYFITVNEPIMTILHGYLSGIYPPFKRIALGKVVPVFRRMVEAHDLLYELLKEPRAALCGITAPQIGIAYNWSYLDGVLGLPFHKLLNEILYSDRFERGGRHSDFLGIQYYFRETMPFFGKKWKGRAYSDHPGFGDIYPAGIGEVLKRLHKAHPGKNIIVTEFGFPDRSDLRRPYWIMETFKHIARAAHEGVPVIGALYWSLVDNFEWDRGMEQRFGLFTEDDLCISPKGDPDRIKGWEAWRACADLVLRPKAEALSRFQKQHALALAQYEQYASNK